MSESFRDVTVDQGVVADVMTRVFAPIAAVVGATLVIVAAVFSSAETLLLGITGLAVGVVGAVQRRRGRANSLVILLVASVGVAFSIPFLQRGEAIALLPTLTLFSLVGVFSLPRRVALLFVLWCGVVTAGTFFFHLTDLTTSEMAVGLLLLIGTGSAGWQFLTIARDALAREQENSSFLFDSSPVAILEEDYRQVGAWLHGLRRRSVTDLRRYLADHPDEIRYGISLIEVLRVNKAAVSLVGAGSVDELVESFGDMSRRDVELASFVEQFVAIWEGRRSLALDLNGRTFDDRPLEAVLHWSVPVRDGAADLARVVVAISDITPRKIVEERLARAVEANERLLAFEHTLASCSRALLLGVGEDALEVALESLREAIGADRAYLAVNVEDPDVGPAFKVVNSASKPEFAQDDWVGLIVPWSKYPMASEPLSHGQSFQHEAGEPGGEGWTRSLLAVPVFMSGQWSGTVGFIDIGRRTEWSGDAVRMLQVAAPMLGTFWEREVTRRRLEDLVQSKDRFLASISHELRTPLSAVLGFAEELKTHASTFEPHESTEILELIAEQSRDMADLVEDLLVAARADIGTISIHPQVVYLRGQAEAALVAIGSTASTTVEVIGGPGKVWADPTRTRQIIRNLLTNAVRYGGDEVMIEAIEGSDLTVLSVRDNGTGLPEAEWERIFEPYQRAHERPTQPSSVGLGLTVSRQLARAMGGDLTYVADEDGSAFQLTLPSGSSDRNQTATAHTAVKEPA